MTPSFDSWEPEAPPPGFADRVTAAVLQDRARRGHRRARRAGAVALLAAACVVVGGAAWAWTSRSRPSEERLAPVERVERADPTPSALLRSLPSEAAPLASVRPVARSRPAPSAAPSASSSRTRGTHVPSPMCICNAYGCDCGPE
jgi:hypothetical protein